MLEQLMEIVRSVVRPFITVASLLFVFWLVAYHEPVPEWLTTQTTAMIVWWFADRRKEGK